MDGKVALADTGSDWAAEMHIAAGPAHCIHSLEEAAAGSRKMASGVHRSSVAPEEGTARCLSVHTGYKMVEVRLETHMVPAVGARMEPVAADMGTKGHTAMDCDAQLVEHIGCMGFASWLQ